MDLNLVKNKMDSAISFFEKELSSIRTSRANASILDNLLVESYGNKTPINQLGNISVPDASMLTIQVWDKNLVKEIENCIIESNLGINPQIAGQHMRIPIPSLNEERRSELKKLMGGLAEKGKVSIRNIRRECNDNIKKLLKDKKISEDESKNYEDEVQKCTDDNISLIEKILAEKEKEILTL